MAWCETGHWAIAPSKDNNGGLMISGFHYAEKESNIVNNNIVAVASIIVPSHYLKIAMPVNVAHKFFSIQDDQDESIKHFFNPTYEFIKENLTKGNVLVHCEAGTSRSATIVLAYLMRVNNWNIDEAMQYLRVQRPCINPNKGFLKDLRKWQNQLGIK